MTNLFKKQAILTNGEQVVSRAHMGQKGADDYLLTPADCQYILDHCDFTQPFVDAGGPEENRDVHDARVKEYMDSIKVKGVLDTGATLKFDTNGNLFDGRHRLTTAIKMGVMFPTLIAFGRDVRAFSVIDAAISVRNKTELFKAAGIRRAGYASSLADKLMKWRAEGSYFVRMYGTHTGEALIDFYREQMDDELAQECIRHSVRAYKTSDFPATPMATIQYILRTQGDGAKADCFMDCIADGLHGGKHAAIKVLLKHVASVQKSNGLSIPALYKMCMFIETWNNFNVGKSGNAKKLAAVLPTIKLDLRTV